jgi:ATP-binding cassette, subfamily B, bacterial
MEGGSTKKNLAVLPTIKVYWDHVRRHKMLLTWLLITLVITNALDVSFPLITKLFFDTLANPHAVPLGELSGKLTSILAILAVAYGARWLFSRASALINTSFQPRIMSELEETAFQKLQDHSYRFFINSFAGSLVRRVSRLSRSFEVIADEVTWKFIQLFILMVGSLVIFYHRNPIIALILVAWIVLFIALNIAVSLWKLKYDTRRAELDSERTAVLSDAITNSITIQQFTGKWFEVKLFKEVMTRWRKAHTLSWRLSDVNDALQAGLVISIQIVVFYVAIRLYVRGTLTIGDFALIQTALFALFDRLWDFGRSIRRMYEAFADAKEMVDIINMPPEIKDRARAMPLVVKKGRIDFRGVSFSYTRARPILSRFQLTIKPHEKVAFVGSSGAGKSTIVKLLMRFFDVTKGNICIDGQNITGVTQESLRANVSLVPQDPVLFHRTLMENIRYGRRDATDAEVLDAAKKARCHEFIQQLPAGYNTYVGERGVKLSGGERQRVAIARAILKNAPILILDEATSSLDSESEALIQDALRELMREKTVIVIAHRLSTIMLMDRILVIENGTLTDEGTHKQLLAHEGVYNKLWTIQAGGFIR